MARTKKKYNKWRKVNVHRPQDSNEESDLIHDATRAYIEESGDARMFSSTQSRGQQTTMASTHSALLFGHGSFPPLPTPAQSPFALVSETDINTSIAPGPSTFREYLLSKPHATVPKAVDALSNACTLVAGDLLSLPNETLGKICEATIVLDRRAGCSLLLTCKKLHAITITAYGDAAKEYAKDQDLFAAVLFEPTSDGDVYLEWMPRLLSRSSPILQLLEEAERLHNVSLVVRKPLLKPFANSDALPVFKVGLYLLGMLHFRHAQDLATGLVETFLDNLPGAALLVLRVTSIMMHALFCHQYSLSEFCHSHSSIIQTRDLIQEVETASRRDNAFTFQPELMPCAFEKLLLTSGLRLPAYAWDHKNVWSIGDGDPLVDALGGTMRNIEYCSKLDQKHPVVVRMRRSRYDIEISERIAAVYPDEVGLLSQEWESVDRQLAKIGEWRGDRSDLEILKEFKAMTGL